MSLVGRTVDHIESTLKDKYGAVQLNSTQKISMNDTFVETNSTSHEIGDESGSQCGEIIDNPGRQVTETSIDIENKHPESFQGYDYDTSGGTPQGMEALKLIFPKLRFYIATTLIGLITIILTLLIDEKIAALVVTVSFFGVHVAMGIAIDLYARKYFDGSMVNIPVTFVSKMFGFSMIKIQLRFGLYCFSLLFNLAFFVTMGMLICLVRESTLN